MVPRIDARDLSILFIAHLVNRGGISPIMEIMHSNKKAHQPKYARQYKAIHPSCYNTTNSRTTPQISCLAPIFEVDILYLSSYVCVQHVHVNCLLPAFLFFTTVRKCSVSFARYVQLFEVVPTTLTQGNIFSNVLDLLRVV